MDVLSEPDRTVWGRLPTATIVTGFIALLVAAMTVLHGVNLHQEVDTWWPGNTTLAIGLGVTGSVLAHKLPRNPIGWLMLTAGAANATMGLGREWAVFVVSGNRSLPGATFAGWWGTWPYIVSLATLPLILMLFPDGTLPSRRWRPVAWALVGFMVMGVVDVMFMTGPFADDMPQLLNPLGFDWVGLTVFGVVGRIGFVLTIVAAISALAVRTRRAGVEVRQQLRWVFLGASVLVVEVGAEMFPWTGDHSFFKWAGPLAMIVFLSCLSVAVLRYRLWDLELLVRMSLIYGVLIAAITAVYVLVVTVFGLIADDQVRIGPSLVAAALGAGAFALLRDRVQRGVERLFYGDRSDPYRALSKLGARLDQPVTADTVLDEVVEAVAQSLRLASVALFVEGSGEVASIGEVGGSMTSVVPLMFRDTKVGELIVAPRAGSRLGRSEMTILADLARPVAAVVHSVAVGEELQRSRRALVTAREAERRRVRRNLHDGLGPALAAVRMKLDSAAILVDSDPDAAKIVLDQLATDIRSTIADIRRLVYDLQPPELDEIGLLQALAAQTRAFSGPLEDGHMLDVYFDSPASVDGLPAAVEVAAYRIVCEALANVARHSSASNCRVTVTLNGDLTLCVDDDGVGIPDVFIRGVGTTSMMERASELGGTIQLGSSPLGGTQVVARLPVGAKPSLVPGEILPTGSTT